MHDHCFTGHVSIKYPEGWYFRAKAPFIQEFVDGLCVSQPRLRQYIQRDPMDDSWFRSGPCKSKKNIKHTLEMFSDLYMEFMEECHPDVFHEIVRILNFRPRGEDWNRVS
jgi:hypothetical protein